MHKIKHLMFAFAALSGAAYAESPAFNPDHPFYVAANLGISTIAFEQNYIDRTDYPFFQNVSDVAQQHSYTGGIAIGYSKLIYQHYFIGAEASASIDTHAATYQDGASSTAFSDTSKIKNHFDLAFIPGMLLTDSVVGYAKIGVSLASVQDNLSSPAGFLPIVTRYYNNNNKSQNATGLLLGLGIKKSLTDRVSVFVEGTYRDYGTTHFSDFQNFTATYTHSAHIYYSSIVAGAAYSF